MTIPAVTTITNAAITKSADPVVTAYTHEGNSTVERLRACQHALAVEYASLRWLEEHPDGVDDLLETGRAVSRRVRALKRLVELELREHRLQGDAPELDLHGPIACQVISLLVTTLINVTTDVVGADDATDVVNKFKSAVEGNPEIPWP